MHSLMNAVFCAPTSFFALAVLMQAVRFACLAAASPSAAGAVAGEAGTFAGGLAWGPLEPSHKIRGNRQEDQEDGDCRKHGAHGTPSKVTSENNARRAAEPMTRG